MEFKTLTNGRNSVRFSSSVSMFTALVLGCVTMILRLYSKWSADATSPAAFSAGFKVSCFGGVTSHLPRKRSQQVLWNLKPPTQYDGFEY